MASAARRCSSRRWPTPRSRRARRLGPTPTPTSAPSLRARTSPCGATPARSTPIARKPVAISRPAGATAWTRAVAWGCRARDRLMETVEIFVPLDDSDAGVARAGAADGAGVGEGERALVARVEQALGWP